MTAVGGPTIYISGSQEKLREHKKRCIKTLAELAVLNNSLSHISLANLVDCTIGSGKKFLGFIDHPKIRYYLESQFSELISELEEENIISQFEGGFLIKNPDFIEPLRKSIIQYNLDRK